MKKQIAKILSIVLSIAVVLSVCGMLGIFNANATNAEKITDYYVGYGGTGDGSSLEKMAATVDNAIKTINANGLTAGDTANIWIVQNITAIERTSESKAYHNLAYYTSSVKHDAKIVIKPYAANQASNSEIPTYLAMDRAVGGITQLIAQGPTEIDGLCLIHCSNQYGFTARFVISAGGNDLTIGADVTYALFDYTSSTAANWTGSTWDATNKAFSGVSAQNNFPITMVDNIGGSAEEPLVYEKPVTLTLKKNVSYAGFKYDLSGFNPGYITFNEDVTFIYDTDSYRPYAQLGTTRAGDGVVTYAKNLNIKLPVATKIGFVAGARKVVVKGGLQLITNDKVKNGFSANDYPFTNFIGNAYTDTTYTTNSDYWILNTAEADTKNIDFISGVTGKFAVANGVKAIATKAGVTKESENGILDLSAAPGEYTVTFEKSYDKVYEYYVKYGGTGDGTSIDNPAPTVAAAIEYMNACKLTAADTATVYIVQDIEKPDMVGGENAYNNKFGYHNLAAWTETGVAIPEHANKIIVKGHSSNADTFNDLAADTYLAFDNLIGKGDYLYLGGPTEFQNLTLVYTYCNSESSHVDPFSVINANGKDLAIGENVKYGYIKALSNNEASWAATNKITSHKLLGFGFGKAGEVYDEAFKVAFNAPIGYSGARIDLPSSDAGTYTFNNDVTLEFNASTHITGIRFGGKKAAIGIFEKNLNFKFNNTETITKSIRLFGGAGTVTVKGGVQIIDTGVDYSDNGSDYMSFDEIEELVDENGNPAKIWEIKVSRDDVAYVDFIEGVTGKFTAAKEGYVAVAFKDSQLVAKAENGVLDLSDEDGTYEIQFLKEVEFDFDKDFDFDKADCDYLKAKLLSDAEFVKDYDINNDNAFNICDLVFLYEKLA